MGSWKDKLLRLDDIQRQARDTVEEAERTVTNADPQKLVDEAQEALDRLGRQTRVELEAADAHDPDEPERQDKPKQTKPARQQTNTEQPPKKPGTVSEKQQQREDRRAMGAKLLQRIEDARATLLDGGPDAARQVLDGAVSDAQRVGLRIDTPSLGSGQRPPDPITTIAGTTGQLAARGANSVERLRETVLGTDGDAERNIPTELTGLLRSEAGDVARDAIEENVPSIVTSVVDVVDEILPSRDVIGATETREAKSGDPQTSTQTAAPEAAPATPRPTTPVPAPAETLPAVGETSQQGVVATPPQPAAMASVEVAPQTEGTESTDDESSADDVYERAADTEVDNADRDAHVEPQRELAATDESSTKLTPHRVASLHESISNLANEPANARNLFRRALPIAKTTLGAPLVDDITPQRAGNLITGRIREQAVRANTAVREAVQVTGQQHVRLAEQRAERDSGSAQPVRPRTNPEPTGAPEQPLEKQDHEQGPQGPRPQQGAQNGPKQDPAQPTTRDPATRPSRGKQGPAQRESVAVSPTTGEVETVRSPGGPAVTQPPTRSVPLHEQEHALPVSALRHVPVVAHLPTELPIGGGPVVANIPMPRLDAIDPNGARSELVPPQPQQANEDVTLGHRQDQRLGQFEQRSENAAQKSQGDRRTALALLDAEAQGERDTIKGETERATQRATEATRRNAAQTEARQQRRAQSAQQRGTQSQTNLNRRGQQRQQQTQVTIQTLRQGVQARYDEQKTALVELENTQRQALLEERTRKEQDAKLAADQARYDVQTQGETRAKQLQTDIENRKKARLEQAQQEIKAAELRAREAQTQLRDQCTTDCARVEQAHAEQAQQLRRKGEMDARASRAKGTSAAQAALSKGDERASRALAAANQRAANGASDTAASTRRAGQQQAQQARVAARREANELKQAAEREASELIQRAQEAGRQRIEEGKRVAEQLKATRDTAIQELEQNVTTTRQQLELACADAVTQMQAALDQGLREIADWVMHMFAEQERILAALKEQLLTQQREAQIKLEAEIAKNRVQTMQRLDQWKQQIEAQIAKHKTADAQIQQLVAQGIVQVGQHVEQVRQRCTAVIQQFGQQADQQIATRKAVFAAQRERGLAQVDRILNATQTRIKREDEIGQQRIQRQGDNSQQRNDMIANRARTTMREDADDSIQSFNRTADENQRVRAQRDQARQQAAHNERTAIANQETNERNILARETGERDQDRQQRQTDFTGAVQNEEREIRGTERKKEVDRGAMRAAAREIWYAMKGGTGWGTDEDAIRKALSGKTPDEVAAIREEYNKRYGAGAFDKHLNEELGGDDLKSVQLLLTGDAAKQAAGNLIYATTSGTFGWGTDEELLAKTLRECKDPAQRRMIAEEYKKATGRTLDTMINAESSGIERDQMKALARGDTDAANAAEMEQAMHGGVLTSLTDWASESVGIDRNTARRFAGTGQYGANGTDEAAMREITERYRNNNTEQMTDAERAAAREKERGGLAALEEAYARRNTALDGGRGNLRRDIDDETQGAENRAVTHGLDANWDAQRAARYRAAIEGNGTWIGGWGTDVDDAAATFEGTTRREREAAVKLIDQEARQYGGQTFAESMDANGGEFDDMDRERMRQTVSTGKMDDAFALYYSMNRAGTDEDRIRQTLQGKSKQEIAEIERRYQDYTHQFEGYRRTLRGDLDGELGGDDHFDTTLLLRGRPENAREEMEIENLRHGYDRAGFGNWFADLYSDEGRDYDKLNAEANQQFQELVQKNLADVRYGDLTADQRREMADFLSTVAVSQVASTQQRQTVDAAANTLATAGAVVAGAVVTVASAGTLGPAAAAAVAAIVSGLTSMTVKTIMLGSRYSMEDAGVDLASTLASAVTAGLVQASAVNMMVQRMVTAMKIPPGVVQSIARNMILEAGAGGLNGLSQALMDENAYKGDLANFLKVVGTTTGSAVLTSMASGLTAGVAERAMTVRLPNGQFVDRQLVANARLAGVLREGFEEGVTELGSLAADPATYEGRFEDIAAKGASRVAQSTIQGGAMGSRGTGEFRRWQWRDSMNDDGSPRTEPRSRTTGTGDVSTVDGAPTVDGASTQSTTQTQPRGTAAPVPNSGFSGRQQSGETRPIAAEADVLVGSRHAGETLGPQIVTVDHSGRMAIMRAGDREVQIVFRLGEVSTDAVATHDFDPRSTQQQVIVEVSPEAHPDDIARAIAHEIAEVHRLLQDPTSESRPTLESGAQTTDADQISAHDAGRRAEVAQLVRELDDPFLPETRKQRLRTELEALVSALKLDAADLAHDPKARALLGEDLAKRLAHRNESTDTRDQVGPDRTASPELVSLAAQAHQQYAGELAGATSTLQQIVGDLGQVAGRAKDPVSAANRLQRAIENGWAKNGINTVQDVYDNLWDAIGNRVVLEDSGPDAMRKVVQKLVEAINAGQITVTAASNEHAPDGMPYFTAADMQSIAAAANAQAKPDADGNITPITVHEGKRMDDGWTAVMIKVIYPSGVRGEIQIMGKQVLEVAGPAHIAYDAGLGKPLTRDIDPQFQSRANTLARVVEAAVNRVNRDPAKKAAYEQYQADLYKHARLVEMGMESTPPTLPPGIDQMLGLEGLQAIAAELESYKRKKTDEAPNLDQTDQPQAESDGKTRPEGKVSTTTEPELPTPGNRQGIPENVPVDQQELRRIVASEHADVVDKFAAIPHTSSDKFDALIAELEQMPPGSLGHSGDPVVRAQNKLRDQQILTQWVALNGQVEKASGIDQSKLRVLYNEVEQKSFGRWQAALAHLPKSQQALMLHMYREELKAYVRDLMLDDRSSYLLRLRDRAVYGYDRGPAFKDLYEKALLEAGGNAEKAYDAIIGSSKTSNKGVNKDITGDEKGLGKKPPDGPSAPTAPQQAAPPVAAAPTTAPQIVETMVPTDVEVVGDALDSDPAQIERSIVEKLQEMGMATLANAGQIITTIKAQGKAAAQHAMDLAAAQAKAAIRHVKNFAVNVARHTSLEVGVGMNATEKGGEDALDTGLGLNPAAGANVSIYLPQLAEVEGRAYKDGIYLDADIGVGTRWGSIGYARREKFEMEANFWLASGGANEKMRWFQIGLPIVGGFAFGLDYVRGPFIFGMASIPIEKLAGAVGVAMPSLPFGLNASAEFTMYSPIFYPLAMLAKPLSAPFVKAREKITAGASRARDAVVAGAATTGRAIRDGANATGRAIRDGAHRVGEMAESGAQAVRDGLDWLFGPDAESASEQEGADTQADQTEADQPSKPDKLSVASSSVANTSLDDLTDVQRGRLGGDVGEAWFSELEPLDQLAAKKLLRAGPKVPAFEAGRFTAMVNLLRLNIPVDDVIALPAAAAEHLDKNVSELYRNTFYPDPDSVEAPSQQVLESPTQQVWNEFRSLARNKQLIARVANALAPSLKLSDWRRPKDAESWQRPGIVDDLAGSESGRRLLAEHKRSTFGKNALRDLETWMAGFQGDPPTVADAIEHYRAHYEQAVANYKPSGRLGEIVVDPIAPGLTSSPPQTIKDLIAAIRGELFGVYSGIDDPFLQAEGYATPKPHRGTLDKGIFVNKRATHRASTLVHEGDHELRGFEYQKADSPEAVAHNLLGEMLAPLHELSIFHPDQLRRILTSRESLREAVADKLDLYGDAAVIGEGSFKTFAENDPVDLVTDKLMAVAHGGPTADPVANLVAVLQNPRATGMLGSFALAPDASRSVGQKLDFVTQQRLRDHGFTEPQIETVALSLGWTIDTATKATELIASGRHTASSLAGLDATTIATLHTGETSAPAVAETGPKPVSTEPLVDAPATPLPGDKTQPKLSVKPTAPATSEPVTILSAPTSDAVGPHTVRKAQNETEQLDVVELEAATDHLREKFGDELSKHDTKLTPPPTDRPVLEQASTDALIGLPVELISPTANVADAIAQLQKTGLPRWGALTAKERAHETEFASLVENNLGAMVNEFYSRSAGKDGEAYTFEVDSAKKLYGAYGKGTVPANPEQLDVRATANHALHPTAVAIARLALLMRLDVMSQMDDKDPNKALFVTNGGCAAGKGSLAGIVMKATGGKFEFGAVWDAAGEGDAQENGWLLEAARARGIRVTFGFVESDPMFTYKGVLDRASDSKTGSGRIVDPITFTRSYVRGQENMRAFMESPAYKDAVAAGHAEAIGVYTGQFDLTTKSFPNKRLLGDDGAIVADDIVAPPNQIAVTAIAIEVFHKWIADQRAQGKNVDHWIEGGIVNPLKFDPRLAGDSEQLDQATDQTTEAPQAADVTDTATGDETATAHKPPSPDDGDAVALARYNATKKAEKLWHPPLPKTRRDMMRDDVGTERLAHGLAYKDADQLTAEDHANLAKQGLQVGQVIHGVGGLDLTTFVPMTGSDATPVLAFRGTKGMADLIDDANPAGVGAYQMAANEGLIAQTLASLQRFGSPIVTGHSLGGALAQMTAVRFSDMVGRVVTFQAPGIPKDMVAQLEEHNRKATETGGRKVESHHYEGAGDLIPLAGEAFTEGFKIVIYRGTDLINETVPDPTKPFAPLIREHIAYPVDEFVSSGEGLGSWPTGGSRLEGRGPASGFEVGANHRSKAIAVLNTFVEAMRVGAGHVIDLFAAIGHLGAAPRKAYIDVWEQVRSAIDAGGDKDQVAALITSSKVRDQDKQMMLDGLDAIFAAHETTTHEEPGKPTASESGPAMSPQYIETTARELGGRGGSSIENVLVAALQRANSDGKPVRFTFSGEVVVVEPGADIRRLAVEFLYGDMHLLWNPAVQTQPHPTETAMVIVPGTATPLNQFALRLNAVTVVVRRTDAQGIATLAENGIIEISHEAMIAGAPTWRELHLLKVSDAEGQEPGAQKLQGLVSSTTSHGWVAPEVDLTGVGTMQSAAREHVSISAVQPELDTLKVAVDEVAAKPAGERTGLTSELETLAQRTLANLTQTRVVLEGALVAAENGRVKFDGEVAIIDLRGRTVEIPIAAGADPAQLVARLREMLALATQLESVMQPLRKAIRDLSRDSNDANTNRVVELTHRVHRVLAGDVDVVAPQQSPVEETDQRAKLPIIPRSDDWQMDVADDKIPAAKREAALAEYGELIARLEAEGMIPMPTGQASVDMMAGITLVTGKEVALIRLETGERMLVLGNQHSFDVPENTVKVIAHTHPGGNLIFSPGDIQMFDRFGQSTSVLISPGGAAVRQSVETNQYQTQASVEHLEVQSQRTWNDDPAQRVMSGRDVATEASRMRGGEDVPLDKLVFAPRRFESIGSNKGLGEGVVTKGVDTEADLEAIRAGRAVEGPVLAEGGRTFEINGRVYGEQYGRVFALRGKGIITLDAVAANTYRLYRDFYDTDPAYVEGQLAEHQGSESVTAGRDAFFAERGEGAEKPKRTLWDMLRGKKAENDKEPGKVEQPNERGKVEQPNERGLVGNALFGRLFGRSGDGLSEFGPDEVVTLFSIRGNPHTGRIVGRDQDGNVRLLTDEGEHILRIDQLDLSRTQRVPVKTDKPVDAADVSDHAAMPLVHAGADADAHVALAQKLGVMPKDAVQVGNATYVLGQLFDIGDGRVGLLFEVIVEGKRYLRVAYRSNSQGGFRVLPARNKGVPFAPGYDKAIGEHSIMLPNEVESFLSQQLVEDSVRRDISGTESQQLFEGGVVVNRGAGDWYAFQDSPDHIKNSVKEQKLLDQPKQMLATEGGHELPAPGGVKIAAEAQRPNFSQVVRTYPSSTATAGDVTALVYHSHDGSLEYVLFKDNRGRVWFQSVSRLDAAITPQGVRAIAVDADALCTPLWEYDSQVPEGYAGARHPTQQSYVDAWAYLSQFPEIQAYYKATGTPMPNPRSGLETPVAEGKQKPVEDNRVAAKAKQETTEAEGAVDAAKHVVTAAPAAAPAPASNANQLFGGVLPATDELWTFQSLSGNFYVGRFQGFDEAGNILLRTNEGPSTLKLGRLATARPGFSHPKLHAFGPDDVVTLYSIRGNKRTGKIVGYDDAGNLRFLTDQGEQMIWIDQLDLTRTHRASAGPAIAAQSKPADLEPDAKPANLIVRDESVESIEVTPKELGARGYTQLPEVIELALWRAHKEGKPVRFQSNGRDIVVAPGSDPRRIFVEHMYGDALATWNKAVQTKPHPDLHQRLMMIVPSDATPLNEFVKRLSGLTAVARQWGEGQGVATANGGVFEISHEAMVAGAPTWRELHHLKVLEAEGAEAGTRKIQGQAYADTNRSWVVPELNLTDDRLRRDQAREQVSFSAIEPEIETLKVAVDEAVAKPVSERGKNLRELEMLAQQTFGTVTQTRVLLEGAIAAAANGRMQVDGNVATFDLRGSSVLIPIAVDAEPAQVVQQLRDMLAHTTRLESEMRQVGKAITELGRDNDDASANRARELTGRLQGVLAGDLDVTAPQPTTDSGAKKLPIIPRSDDWQLDVSADNIPEAKREAAREKYGEIIARLQAEGVIPMPTGQASVDMMAGITLVTGKEVALVRLKTGERVLVLGNQKSVSMPDNTARLIAHTHPSGSLIFSPGDIEAFSTLDQQTSVLISPAGGATRQSVKTNQNQTQASTEHLEVQSRLEWNDDPSKRVISGNELASEASQLRGSANVPLEQLALAPRHYRPGMRGVIQAVVVHGTDSGGDLEAIRAGGAVEGTPLLEGGRTFEINGRVYGEQYGRVFPLRGEGIITLDEDAASTYRLYRDYYDSDPDFVAKELDGREGVESVKEGREAFFAERGGDNALGDANVAPAERGRRLAGEQKTRQGFETDGVLAPNVQTSLYAQGFDGDDAATGDVVKVLRGEGNNVHFLVGDMTGHASEVDHLSGRTAAESSVLLHRLIDQGLDAALVQGGLAALDQEVSRTTNSTITGAMTHLTLDQQSGVLKLEGAMDTVGFVVRNDGTVQKLENNNAMFGYGMIANDDASFQLTPGDRVIVISDGVWGRFGDIDAVMALLADAGRQGKTAEEIVEMLKPKDGQVRSDDETALGFQWRAPGDTSASSASAKPKKINDTVEDAHDKRESASEVDQATHAAFAKTSAPHPEQTKFQLKGSSNFAFKSADMNEWPNQLTYFLADQFHVERERLRVIRFGAGKSGDLVFGVWLDQQNLGVLKVYRDPTGAGVDAQIIHIIEQAQIPHYVPAENKGGISDVSIDGAAGSSLFTELVPGQSIESLIQRTPKEAATRAGHVDMLENAVRSAAVSLASLHTTMATGKHLEKSHKQNEARFVMAKFKNVRAANDAKHFTTSTVLDQVERKMWDEIIPQFVESPLPATAYHGDAHVGNFMVDEQMVARPIDLTSMKWSLDSNKKGRQTAAVDVGQFIARLYEKSEGALELSEVERLKEAFVEEYFRHTPVAQSDMKAGTVLYAVESQFARIAYDIGDPKDALAAAARLLGIEL